MQAKFKILSLDGGGSWALAQAKCLKNLYPQLTGHQILKKFDLVVANSGGSIVLASLLEDFAPETTEALFLDEEKRRQIFVKIPFYRKLGTKVLRIFDAGPKYRTSKKLEGLKNVFPKYGQVKLDQITRDIQKDHKHIVNVLIMAYDYDRLRSVFLRSNRQSLTNSFHESMRMGRTVDDKFKSITLAEAVHASTNAPVNYFDKPALVDYGDQELRAWDGGLGGYNNPVLAGLTEALRNKIPLENIHILSLGTANKVLPLRSISKIQKAEFDGLFIREQKPSFFGDLTRVGLSILAEPPESALYITHTFLASQLNEAQAQDRLLRMSPLIQPIVKPGALEPELHVPEGLTNAEFEDLINFDIDLIRQKDVDLINKFFDLWLADKASNQPVRQDSRTLRPLIGSLKFSDVKKKWLEISEND